MEEPPTIRHIPKGDYGDGAGKTWAKKGAQGFAARCISKGDIVLMNNGYLLSLAANHARHITID